MIVGSYMLRQDITTRKALVADIAFKSPQAIVAFLVSLEMLWSLEASCTL